MNHLLRAFLIVFCVRVGFGRAATYATQPASRPSEIRHGLDVSGSREARAAALYKSLLDKIEPSQHGELPRLPQYLDFFTREFIHDQRTFACVLNSKSMDANRAVIQGYFEFAESKASLDNLLKHLNLSGVDDETELLPAADLGDHQFGVITSPHAFVYSRPEGKRETLTECDQHDTVFVLKKSGTAILCHAPSGYVGYIDDKDVQLIDAEKMNELETSTAVEHGSKISSMIATASGYLGVKYVWGANSKEGIDCSGLVYNAFKSIGVVMPRDADQQFLLGRLVATRWHRNGLRRGDTLYFLSRRGLIHHTAIYLGDNKFIEATEPVAKISSFDPKDPNYSEKRDKSFCFGKRVIE